MRPFIPVDLQMKATSSLLESVAADLAAPDAPVSSIIPSPTQKSRKKNEINSGTSADDNNSGKSASE